VTTFNRVYAGEANTTHAGVNITNLGTQIGNLGTGITLAAAASEAFDEPLSRAAVIEIVQPFFVPTLT
jgi:hypothetical protein